MKKLFVLAVLAFGCADGNLPQKEEVSMADETAPPRTDAEWKKILTPEQFQVTRMKGTERAFTGEYNNFKEDGVFHCVCCGQALFDSKNKFDSGCGWPAFWNPADKEKIRLAEDHGLGMTRMEVLCSGCDAHLGHVFEDGPEPTGLRFCINSVSLKHQER